jgi:hypothetical protein
MFPLTLLILLNLNAVLDADLWLNKDDAVYQFGEKLTIFFETTEDCFAAVYDIEPGGEAVRLFPPEGRDGRVDAEQTYELPPAGADVDYVIGETAGEEEFVILVNRDRPPTLGDTDPGTLRKSVKIAVAEPEPARLMIVSTPTRARIYLTEVASGEKVYLGRAPKTVEVESGAYIVTIKLSGYHTISRRIELDAGDRRRIFVRLWD